MGTKIQASLYLRDYHPVIDLDASTNNSMRSTYNENGILENGKNPHSLSSYDIEKARQKILEHESIFKNQIRELHRLYGRQRELMNEIKRRGIINKENAMEEKFQFSYSFPPENAKKSWNSCHSSSQHLVSSCEPRILNNGIVPSGSHNLGFPADSYFSNMEKRMQESFSKFPIVESTAVKRNHQTAFDGDNRFSLSAVQHGGDSLTFDLYSRKNYPGGISLTNPKDLSREETSANSRSNLNLVTKDFFHDSLDIMNKEDPLSILGSRNERSGKEHLSGDYADKRTFDKHSYGKFMAFPQSPLAEPRKEFSKFPLSIGTSLSRKKKKIFGVEISEGNDDAYDLTSNMSSNLERGAVPQEEKHRVPFLKPSSFIADSFVPNLKLHGENWKDCKSERSKKDLKGEISSQTSLSCHSGMNVKWLEGNSKNYIKNVDNKNAAADVLKKDPENSQKLPDCQSNQENPKGSLPWFLRNSQVSGEMNKGTKSSYFMNLDSLQNCSQKFFGGTFQTPKQKKEIEGEISKDDDVLQSFKSRNSGENLSKVNCSSIGDDCDENASRNHVGTKELVLDKGLNNCKSDLRHCIDLNLSLDEEDSPFAPSLPSAIVKIATTEIDLEAPAVIDSEVDGSPRELNSRKSDILPCYQECDKIAAEAMIAISLSVEKKSVDDNSLKWFAEVISSEQGDNASVAVDVSMNESRAREEEEEAIPDGMDYFEFMTLKLEDTKEDYHHYKAFVLKTPSDDEAGSALTRRTRRGQSRRGRQRRDFQRDILPGLVTLSRLQVTEDFQAFEELLKAGGSNWQSHRSSTRNGRGRKRLGGATVLPTIETPCSTQAQQPFCHIEEKSLTGWGKKTRRLPRQRCPNAFLAFPVKC